MRSVPDLKKRTRVAEIHRSTRKRWLIGV